MTGITGKGIFVVEDKRDFTILVYEWVTGGGLTGSPLPASWAAEGLAMRRAIAADFACLPGRPVRVVVPSDARLPDEPGRWTTVPGARAGDSDGLLALARTADLTVLIAPETSGILAHLTRGLERAGIASLGSTAAAVELAADKARLAARLQELKIATPPSRTIEPAAGMPADTVYPAVLKPVDGAGSVDTYYLTGAGDLLDSARAMPVALLQPFLSGTAMSASFLVGPAGERWLIGLGRQHMAIHAGRFHYEGGTVPVPCPLAVPELERAIAAVEGLRGFVGVDFLWNASERQATIIEINPRPTTSCVGLRELLAPGLLAQAWLAACGPATGDRRILTDLARLIHDRERALSFAADGKTCIDDREGSFS
jgi:predicted ATP-grasp superfamily ATP-dependent carboligase